MKMQSLAVIFIIIILPISLVLNSYVQSQAKTLSLQISYDSKLNNATYDALKAFQLNTINSSTSDLANSKLRDIEASVNTFFNSVSSNFNMAGYNQDILKNYVPALVYTMYDGYYIYSPYTNTLTDAEENPKDENGERLKDENGNPTVVTYHNGDKIAGLKPYIHYSCRYVDGNVGTDVVITYSLDNYITVQGIVNGKPCYKYGYLLDNIITNGETVSYRGISINSEKLEQYVTKDIKKTYVKVNGTKYYKVSTNIWSSIINGKQTKHSINYKENNEAAKQYYKEAKKFSQWVKDNLGDLTGKNAVDENGNTLSSKFGNRKIFDFSTTPNTTDSIEDPDSDFNQHRLEVIRYSIEKNLSIAIANYNNYTGVTTNFRMPVLKEDEWNKIIHNVSIISFMQGLNIGGKVYNGYSIITNTKNKEVVSDESIYLADKDYYYKPTDTTLKNTKTYNGVLNIDFERTVQYDDESGITKYFFPKRQWGSYTSIVNSFNEINLDNKEYKNNIYKYIDSTVNNLDYGTGNSIAKAYYTALGRERYSMYKTNTNIDVEYERDADGNITKSYYSDEGLRKAYNKE